MKQKIFLKLFFQWAAISIIFSGLLLFFVNATVFLFITVPLIFIFITTAFLIQLIRFKELLKKQENILVQTNLVADIATNSTVQPPIFKNETKKLSLLSVGKMLLICALLLEILVAFTIVGGYGSLKNEVIQSFFGGSVEDFNKYIMTNDTYNRSSQGNWDNCLDLDPEQKQFCLWVAHENTYDNKICDNMSPTIYPPDHMYSQDSCYINIAAVNNDKSVCDRVTDIEKCKSLFARLDAQREICGPLFEVKPGPSPSDCYDYAVSQKTKIACDGLDAAGGQNWKDLCYISAGAVSKESMEIVPTTVGQCIMTKVARVGVSDQNNKGIVSEIEYLNKVHQVSKVEIAWVDRSEVGDIIHLCLTSVPKDCSIGDTRGTVYTANNMRLGAVWQLPNSLESCNSN